MIEKIGNVQLDYEFYPGEDLYCDGAIEDEILDIVKNNSPALYRKIIEERANWPILYHLSCIRENIVSWLPIDKNSKVLEVGAGCGAITGALAKKAGSVTCIDLSKKRSLINAYRHQECDNITIQVGNFRDIETVLPADYDYICLIGVFEYALAYMGTEHPYEDMMNILKKHLSPGGRLVIAIENKFGLKYWAGCREDHSGRLFDGIENYQNHGVAKTFTRRGLEEILNKCGMKDYSFYYPYPDYKFPTTIFSDVILPKSGELYANIRNFDRDRLLLFDEQKAFDAILEEGLFSLYSNSYIVITGTSPEVKYVKYSNDRADKYAIQTQICEKADKTRVVTKQPITEEAAEHVKHIVTSYEKLTKRYRNSRIQMNQCKTDENGARFEFLYGQTLEEVFDNYLKQQKKEEFVQLFQTFYKEVSVGAELDVTDWDLIFANILLPSGVDGDWVVIDYEWTFEKIIAPKTIIDRALYCYLLGDQRRRVVLDWLKEQLGEAFAFDEEAVREEEGKFQQYVEEQAMALCDVRNAIGYRVLNITEIEDMLTAKLPKIQIYHDQGEGFSEAGSEFLSDVHVREDVITCTFTVREQDKNIRFDPAMCSGTFELVSLSCDGKEVDCHVLKPSRHAVKLNRTICLFGDNDPSYTCKKSALTSSGDAEVKIAFKMQEMEQNLAKMIMSKVPFRG